MSVGSSNDLVYEYEYKESASQTIPLAKPESTIASFVGWYFDAAFTKSEYNGLRIEDGKLLIPAGYSAPIMLFAKFELPENYAYINYPLDVNLPLDAPSSFEIGTTVALPTPTKAGYIFRGWYTDAALTQPITEINSSITSDVTLYAKWSLIYLEEDFSATVSTPVTLGGNIGNLLVNGNNASSSYTTNNGHLVWTSTAGWGFIYTSNPAIMKSNCNLSSVIAIHNSYLISRCKPSLASKTASCINKCRKTDRKLKCQSCFDKCSLTRLNNYIRFKASVKISSRSIG